MKFFTVILIAAVLVVGVIFFVNRNQPVIKSPTSMKISATVFKNQGIIPARYTCEGDNVNPGLVFENVPTGARSLALIMDDPDAPIGTFTHWVIYNIPPESGGVAESSRPPGVEAKNSTGEARYSGPCPPMGTHRYYFKLYALDTMLPADHVSNKNDLTTLMHGHILEQAELMGKFGK